MCNVLSLLRVIYGLKREREKINSLISLARSVTIKRFIKFPWLRCIIIVSVAHLHGVHNQFIRKKDDNAVMQFFTKYEILL